MVDSSIRDGLSKASAGRAYRQSARHRIRRVDAVQARRGLLDPQQNARVTRPVVVSGLDSGARFTAVILRRQT